MKQGKRILSLLLALVMVVGVIPVTALAEENAEVKCVCTDAACTPEALNKDCPVCGAADADLSKCAKNPPPAATQNEEPKPEEPKGEEPKGEEPEGEEPKGEEPEGEEPKGEEPKGEEPEGEEPKGEEPEGEEPKGEEPEGEEPKGEEPEGEEPKNEEPAGEPEETPAIPQAVLEVQAMIDAFPTVDELAAMSLEEKNEVYTKLQTAYEAYEALTPEEQAQVSGTEVFDALFGFINGMVNTMEEGTGSFTVSGGTEGSSYTYENNTLTILTDDQLTISGGGGGDKILVPQGVTANVTLNGVNIDVSGTNYACAFEVLGTCNLTLVGVNVLKSGYDQAGLQVEEGAALTIDGQGSLTAQGGSDGAGIGGGRFVGGGTITINDGMVKAQSSDRGAGIGGGFSGSGGNITISGGTVKATGGEYGAGIGGGSSGSGGNITISGGAVTATGGEYGAGIGGGERGSGGTITIQNGTVEARGGKYSAGIGGSREGSGGDITISGGSVTAYGGHSEGSYGGGAGIGGGGIRGSGGNITISGGEIKAYGGDSDHGVNSGAGIGGGGDGNGGNITIIGGTVNAYGGNQIGGRNYYDGGAGIGGGCRGDGGNITITCDNVTATGGYDGAGIGGGHKGSGGIIRIIDGVAAQGNDGADDIGNGYDSGPCIVFTNGKGEIKGEGDMELPENLTVGETEELTISEGRTLIVPQGMTLTNNGKIEGAGTIDLSGGGSLTGNDVADTITLQCGVTSTLENLTFAGDTKANNKADYTATLTPATGYGLPDTITVKVGGVALGDTDYSYNSESGEITIPMSSIRGNIAIEAAGVGLHTHDGETYLPWDGIETEGYFYLTKTEYPSAIILNSGGDLHLCLNGHALAQGSNEFELRNSSLTILGHGEEKGRVIVLSPLYVAGGALTVSDCEITSNGENCIDAGSSSVNIFNATLSSTGGYGIQASSSTSISLGGNTRISGTDGDIYLANNDGSITASSQGVPYSGGSLRVALDESSFNDGDVVVRGVNNDNAGKFTLVNSQGHTLKRVGDNLVYASTHTVTFDPDNGGESATQTVTSGDKVTQPADPEKSGHRFSGWFQEGAEEAWNFATDTVTEDLTLTARYDPFVGQIIRPNGATTEATQKELLAELAHCREDGTIVKLTSDIGGPGNESLTDILVSKVTLDLNGYTLYGRISVNHAELTIQDNSQSGDGNIYYGTSSLWALVGGTIHMQGGKIESTKTVVDVYGGTFKMSGGALNGGSVDVWAESGVVEISGGSLSSSQKNIMVDEAQVTVTGGTFGGRTPFELRGSADNLTIQGGTYTQALKVANSNGQPQSLDQFVQDPYGVQDANSWRPVAPGETEIRGPVTVTSRPSYTVQFQLDEETIPDQTVAHGGTATAPTVSRPGYSVSWFADATFTENWDFGTPITGNITLYGRWTLVAPTITPLDDYIETYDGQEHEVGITAVHPLSADYPLTYEVYKDSGAAPVYEAAKFNVKDVADSGTYKIVVTISDGTQTASSEQEITVTITKATVTPPTITPKTYTGSPQTATVSDTDRYTVEKNEGGTNVGSYDVVLELTDSSNYKWSDGDEAAEKTLTFQIIAGTNEWTTPLTMAGWTYGGTASDPSAVSKWGTPVYSYFTSDNKPLAEKPTSAGSYFVKATVPADGQNYDEITASVPFTIEQKPVGLTWAAPDMTYDGQAKAPTATATGVIDGDTVNVTVEKAAGDNENVTSEGFQFEAKSLDNGNYKLPQNVDSPVYKITPKSVTISGLTAENKVYDGTVTATISGTAAVDGAVANDDVTVTMGTATFDTKDVDTNKTVTGTDFALEGADAGNYNLLRQPSWKADIAPATITVTDDSDVTVTKVYDGNTDPGELTGSLEISGVVGMENVSVTAVPGSYGDANVGMDKTVTLSLTLAGADAGNYTLAANTWKFTQAAITQATNQWTTQPAISGWTYGDPAKSPVGAAKFGTVQFTYCDKDKGEIGATAPTDAGTYFLKATVVGNDNYTGLEVYVPFAIAKADPTVTWPTDLSGDTGAELSTVVLPEGFTWDAPTTKITYGVNEYPMTFTPEDTDNYNSLKMDVEVKGNDVAAPTAEITVSTHRWNTFLNNITFDLFFKATQSVTITASDTQSGLASIQYFVTDTAQTLEQVKVRTSWTAYDKPFNVNPDGKFIVYAKATDNAGNTLYLSSDGLILDATAPAISGIENGKTYLEQATFTVTDANLNTVTVDGKTVTLTDGKYTITADNKDHIVTATDKAGNSVAYRITVLEVYTVTYKADGKVVDTQEVPYGQDATPPKVPAKSGYSGKWDKDGKNITEDTVITAKYTKSWWDNPKTGDAIRGVLVVLVVSATALACIGGYAVWKKRWK